MWWPVVVGACCGDILEGSGQDRADSASWTAGGTHFGIETTLTPGLSPKVPEARMPAMAYLSRSQIIKNRRLTYGV